MFGLFWKWPHGDKVGMLTPVVPASIRIRETWKLISAVHGICAGGFLLIHKLNANDVNDTNEW